MRRRIVVGLAAGLVLSLVIDGSATSDAPAGASPDARPNASADAPLGAPAGTPAASLIAAVRMTSLDPLFGGFSAIELGADGTAVTLVSDRGTYAQGRLLRDAQGMPLSLDIGPVAALQGAEGDSEGLATGPDGQMFVSFEGSNQIARFASMDGVPVNLPTNPDFAQLPENEGLEALAIDAQGTIYAVPEVLRGDTSPVYVFRDGAWRDPLSIPRIGKFHPVSADVGPDGRLYLLERRFDGLVGFASRLRRFDIGQNGLSAGIILFETPAGLHDNLEGLSVWRDPGGLRATMISDDNFFVLQITEIVEYRLPD